MHLIDFCIYILARFGLIFTLVSIFEMYQNSSYIKYCNNYCKKEKTNEINITIKGIKDDEINSVLKKIKNGDYEDIYELGEDVKIMKYN